MDVDLRWGLGVRGRKRDREVGDSLDMLGVCIEDYHSHETSYLELLDPINHISLYKPIFKASDLLARASLQNV